MGKFCYRLLAAGVFILALYSPTLERFASSGTTEASSRPTWALSLDQGEYRNLLDAVRATVDAQLSGFESKQRTAASEDQKHLDKMIVEIVERTLDAKISAPNYGQYVSETPRDDALGGAVLQLEDKVAAAWKHCTDAAEAAKAANSPTNGGDPLEGPREVVRTWRGIEAMLSLCIQESVLAGADKQAAQATQLSKTIEQGFLNERKEAEHSRAFVEQRFTEVGTPAGQVVRCRGSACLQTADAGGHVPPPAPDLATKPGESNATAVGMQDICQGYGQLRREQADRVPLSEVSRQWQSYFRSHPVPTCPSSSLATQPAFTRNLDDHQRQLAAMSY